VSEAFAEERPALTSLPPAPYRAVLRLERRVSHEGLLSVGGNLYSVPNSTRRRVLDVHVMADEIRIYEEGARLSPAIRPLRAAAASASTRLTARCRALQDDAPSASSTSWQPAPANASRAALLPSTTRSGASSPPGEARDEPAP
jgi:hypothetical protein